MNTDWLQDGRKIPDTVMFYVRVLAVNAVRERGLSPENVVNVLGFNRACIYRWLRVYDEGGYAALESEPPPGAEPIITDEMDAWLKRTILSQTPLEFGYDTPLWTCGIIVDILKNEFHVVTGESTVRLHLKAMGLTPQKPSYRDVERDEREIEFFLNEKFPRIQRLAKRIHADIGFQDESGVGMLTRHGRTWGRSGESPVVQANMKRGGFNVLSMVTTQGVLRYSIRDGHINGEVFIDFLKQVIHGRENPLILLLDHASFHSSAGVRHFVHAHRDKIRIYFLPKRCPEMNPDEQVWNEVKVNHIGKQSIKDKPDLKKRLKSALAGLQKNTKRILSFFKLPNTKYAAAASMA